MEGTERLLGFSSKYLGCRICHVNKRTEIVVNDLHYSTTQIVLPSQCRCCPPKIHFHVPVQPAWLPYCNFPGITLLWEVFRTCVFEKLTITPQRGLRCSLATNQVRMGTHVYAWVVRVSDVERNFLAPLRLENSRPLLTFQQPDDLNCPFCLVVIPAALSHVRCPFGVRGDGHY